MYSSFIIDFETRSRPLLRTLDLLYDYLMRARATGAVFARTVVAPPWGLRLDGSIQLSVHAVTRGRAWMWLDDPSNATELLPGEITLVRGGSPHYIAHESGADCLESDTFRVKHALSATAADHASTIFLCGAYQFSGDVGNGLLEALPQSTTISYAIGEPLQEVISLISRELLNSEPGQQTVLDRLLDVLLVLALRSDFRDSEKAPGWYVALANPRLRATLQVMHDDPSHSWTVPELAEVSGLSRAAFAKSFREAIGQAPLQYLTEWRMTLARDLLRNGNVSLANIALEVGYSSPYAFATAFRRHHGMPPGVWRKQQPSELLTLNGVTDPSAQLAPSVHA